LGRTSDSALFLMTDHDQHDLRLMTR